MWTRGDPKFQQDGHCLGDPLPKDPSPSSALGPAPTVQWGAR